MKSSEFQKLLKEHTSKTKNVRAWSKDSYSSVCKIPDDIASKIGCIVALLQDKINAGNFCQKSEYLMIYNLQPLYVTDTDYLCSLDVLIRPIDKINDLETCEGKPLHFVINGKNGEVANDAYGMKIMGLLDEEEEQAEGSPVCYGNYLDYEPKVAGFKTKLTALQSMGAATIGTNTSSETKLLDELQFLRVARIDGGEYAANGQKVVTFAFNVILSGDCASPTSSHPSTPTSSPASVTSSISVSSEDSPESDRRNYRTQHLPTYLCTV